MSEIWKPQTIEVYESWISAIKEETSDNLTQWEFNFVIDIEMYLTNGRQLSQKQADILERIYTEKTK